MPATPPPPLLPSHSSHSIPRASPDSPTGSPRKHRSSFLTRRDSQPEDGYPVSANGTGFNAGLHERRDSGAKWGKEKDAYGEASNVVDISPNVPETPKKSPLSAAAIIPIWIALSSSVILYNKYLYDTAKFPYPIFLTSYHLGCAALGTRLLRATTNLMNGLDNITMTRDMYIRSILPIGVLFSGSLILSNTAYLSLSVSFIQMLKAFTPVAILLISAIFRLQQLNQRLVLIVILISTGCALAAYGEINFEMFGFVCQACAVLFESSRLVMIQILLQGLKMDPLCSLHFYAPVCAIINACFLPFTEGLAPFREFMRVGPLIMLSNASVAFGLNVAAVFLIGAAGGLVLTLAGVFKDILLISSSCLFFGSQITRIQVFGYTMALCGLFAYKNASGK